MECPETSADIGQVNDKLYYIQQYVEQRWHATDIFGGSGDYLSRPLGHEINPNCLCSFMKISGWWTTINDNMIRCYPILSTELAMSNKITCPILMFEIIIVPIMKVFLFNSFGS